MAAGDEGKKGAEASSAMVGRHTGDSVSTGEMKEAAVDMTAGSAATAVAVPTTPLPSGAQTSDKRGYAKLEADGSVAASAGRVTPLRAGVTVRSGVVYEVAGLRAPDPEVSAAAERLERRVAYRAVKRVFDVAFSLAVLALFSWLFLVVAVAVKVDDPKGPVLFRQTRVGRDGRTFRMYKFRSMCVDAEDRLGELETLNEKTGPVFKMADDPRVTRVGKWLRKLSIDELPQFVNVLKGDLSVVGPRPALPSEVAEYTLRQRQRLLVKQGLTCYWQTRRNRDAITFDEWVDLDLLYIKKCSVWSDLKLIVQTVGVVFTAQGS